MRIFSPYLNFVCVLSMVVLSPSLLASKGQDNGQPFLEIQNQLAELGARVDQLEAGGNSQLGPISLAVDCDVIQADGGTRTASITGSMVALVDALQWLKKNKKVTADLLKHLLAAVSVGIYEGEPILDLDYEEDSKAHTDLNVVMSEKGEFVEIQGTAEGDPFSEEQLQSMLELAKGGIYELIAHQKQVIGYLS